MKPWIKILFTGIIVLALLFSAIYIFLVFQGKALITKQLAGFTKKNVSMNYFGIRPLLNLEIKKLNIEGLAKIDSVYISPSILGMLTGRLVLNNIRIIKPEFTFQKVPPQVAELTVTMPSAPGVSKEPKKKPRLRLIFKRLTIQDGKLNFIDYTLTPEGIKVVIKDINLNLNNVYGFRSVITNLELKGRIPWRQGQQEGRVEAEGWLNFFKKDMQATLKIEDIDAIYLYPYYSSWVDLEKARIESAKLNFTSNINGLNNNVTAECHLELSDIKRRSLQPEEEDNKAAKITDVVLDVFRALNQGKIVLDFTIRTKMDRPEFGFGSIKMAFEDKLAQAKKPGGFRPEDVLSLPAKLLEGTFKGATDLTKAVVVGAIEAGKEIGKAVGDTFKKEKKE